MDRQLATGHKSAKSVGSLPVGGRAIVVRDVDPVRHRVTHLARLVVGDDLEERYSVQRPPRQADDIAADPVVDHAPLVMRPHNIMVTLAAGQQ